MVGCTWLCYLTGLDLAGFGASYLLVVVGIDVQYTRRVRQRYTAFGLHVQACYFVKVNGIRSHNISFNGHAPIS